MYVNRVLIPERGDNMKLSKQVIALSGVAFVAIFGWQIWNTIIAGHIFDAALDLSDRCLTKDESFCLPALGTFEGLEDRLAFAIPALARFTVDPEDYLRLKNHLIPRVKPLAEVQRAESAALERASAALGASLRESMARSRDAKQQSLADARERYAQLAAPKLLFRCNEEITLLASKGLANYNALYEEAEQSCSRQGGVFELIQGAK